MKVSLLAVVVLALVAGSATAASAQQSSVPPPPVEDPAAAASTERPIDPDELPVDIRRIQRMVSRPPAIRPENTRAVFRVQVFSRKPTIDDILGPDWRKGPTPAGAMTHGEFLDLVTPTAVRGYAAFDNKQALTVAATSFALQWAVTKAMDKLKTAVTERQKDEAKKEVDEALAALRKARREAGLPDM